MNDILTLIKNHSQKCSTQKALLFLEDGAKETGSLSYADLEEQSKSIAAFLQTKKMTDQRIMLLYPPGLDFVIQLIGCWYAGVIAVPIHCPQKGEFKQNADLLNGIAEDADIAAVFTLDEYKSSIESVLKKKVAIFATDTLKQVPSKNYKAVSIDKNTIAYLQYTSGSTSLPKGAVVSHGNLIHSLTKTIKAWHYTKKSVTLTWAPHTHVYGLVCGILVPLYHGSLAILMPPKAFINNPSTWLTAITKYRVTHSGCPNFGYDLCLRSIKKEQLTEFNLKHWKVAVNGGDMAQQKTMMDFVALLSPCGFKLNQFSSVYGMSELAGAIALTPYGQEPEWKSLRDKEDNRTHHRMVVSSGRALEGLEVLAVDPGTKRALKDGETGEIWIAGPSVVLGYWRRPEETAEVFGAKRLGSSKEYFRTGDLGFISENKLYLTGRLKEVIIIYGKKYYPVDLESSISKALADLDISLPQVAFSTKVLDVERIVIVQEVPDSCTKAALSKIHDVIRHVLTRDHGVDIHELILTTKGSIPKTGSGKLQRKKCQQLYEKKALEKYQVHYLKQNHEKNMLDDLLVQDLVRLVAEVLEIEESAIDLSVPLSRYSFDSINIIKLTSLINESYALNLTPAFLYEYATLEEFYIKLLRPQTAINKTPIKELERTNSQDIAIIGMSGIFPKAGNLELYWHNLVEQRDCISEVPAFRWDWHGRTIPWGGFIDGIDHFDAAFFSISPHEAELIDPQQRLFLQTVWNTIEDAGYTPESLSKVKTGLYVGVFNHDYSELVQKNEVMDAYLTTGTMNSMIANRISYVLNLHGPSEAIDTACSSSLVAIHQAVQAILHGDCDLAIAGGVNALISPNSFISAQKAGMLSEDGRCKTFDKAANGYVRGEGVGALLLKRLDNALDDGDHIYGVIKGSAVNHGGHVPSLTAPNPNAQAEVIVSAIKRSQVPVDTISYIETHGTGTPLGDPIEINGLKKAFSQLAQEQNIEKLQPARCGLGAVKSNIGHLESAAGMAGIMKILLAMQHELIPANLHIHELNPYIHLDDSPFYIVDKPTQWLKSSENIPRRAGISSFGFGGANAHILIEEAPESLRPSFNSPFYLLVLSAKTDEALWQRLHDLKHWLEGKKEEVDMAALSSTLALGRSHFAKRLCIIANGFSQCKKLVSSIESFDGLALKPVISSNQKIPQEFMQLAEDYLSGKTIDWSLLFGDYKEKISLPTYPFAKESHWIKTQSKNEAIQDVKTEEGFIYSTRCEPNAFYLLDHQIDNEPVFPGVLCLETVRLAVNTFNKNEGAISFSEIQWKKPIKGEDLTKPIYVRLEEGNNSYSFALTDQTGSRSFAEGMFHYVDKGAIPFLDIKKLEESLTYTQNPSEIYERFKQAGLNYGRSFQTLARVVYNAKHALAKLILDEESIRLQEEMQLKPSLLDGMLQTTGVLLKQKESLYLPFSIRQLDVYKPIPNICSVYSSLISDESEDDFPEFDIHVMDESGALVLVISGFTLGLVSQEKPESATTVYYIPRLIEKPVENISFENKSCVWILNSQNKDLEPIRSSLNQAGFSADIVTDIQHVSKEQLGHRDTLLLVLDEQYDSTELSSMDNSLNCSFYSLHSLVQSLITLKKRVNLVCVSTKGSVYTRALQAYAKTLHEEYPSISCRILELSDYSLIANELNQNDLWVRYEGNQSRVVMDYQQAEKHNSSNSDLMLKPKGIYWITGGMGGLGYLFAKFLAKNYQASLILTGRTALGEEYQEKIKSLELFGATVLYLQADVSLYSDVEKVLGQAHSYFGSIQGIIHAAGVTRDSLIAYKTNNECEEVFAPKIQGVLNIHQATLAEPLDFMIFFSSVASVFGNAGQSDYAYANAYLDHFAQEREDQKNRGLCFGKTCSINWPLWVEGGLQIETAYQKILEEQLGIIPLATEKGLEAFAEALASRSPQFMVLSGYQRKLKASLEEKCFIADTSTENRHLEALSESTDSDFRTKTEWFLKNILAETLKCAPKTIEAALAFEHYGIDSLMINQLNQRLSKVFKSLPKTLFFEYQNLSSLTDYFVQAHAEELYEILEEERPAPKTLHKPLALYARNLRFGTTKQQSSRDIAIIGVYGRYPGAENLDLFWANLSEGKDSITTIPKERWDYTDYFSKEKESVGTSYSIWGGFIKDADKFDPMFFSISPREAMLMDPQERVFLETAWSTIEDAGYAKETLAGQKIGVFVGVMYGQYQLYGQGQGENFIPTHSLFSSIANRVSYYFDFHGPSIALDTMCSSSLTAIHLACKSILDGESTMALAGGVNLSIHPNKYLLLSQGNFLSTDGHCRSFGEGGDGYVPGEGVGAVLLKPLDKALADGDRIYALIRGSQLNHGGKTNGYTVPNPNAQADLLEETYRQAKLDPARVSYIEAHGTGTALGDPIELAGLSKVFRKEDRSEPCALGSVKSNIGHCESAAGIAAISKVLLQFKHQKLVPSLGAQSLNPHIDWEHSAFRVQQTLSEWVSSDKPRVAGVSSFGAGGSNAHIILEECTQKDGPAYKTKSHYILAVSAKTPEALNRRIGDLIDWLEHNPASDIESLSYTLNCGRSHFEHRCALIASNTQEALNLLVSLSNNKDHPQIYRSNTTDKASKNKALEESRNEVKDFQETLSNYAKAYVAGQNLDWQSIHAGESKKTISLPTYPFARERYWYSDTAFSLNQSILMEHDLGLLEKIRSFLTQKVRTILQITQHHIDLGKNLGEYGMDSVHFVALGKAISEFYKVESTPAVFYTHSSIASIADYILDEFPKESAIAHQSAPFIPPQESAIKSSFTKNSSSDAIAIIGIHGVFPQSENVDQFWEHLVQGHDLVTEVPKNRWDWNSYYGDTKVHLDKSNSKWGGFIEGIDQFDAGFFSISAREAHLMDPQQRLFLETVWKTIEDAGYDPLSIGEDKVGVFAGVEFSEYQSLIAQYHKDFHGSIATGNSHSMIANRVSYFLNFQGPSEAVDTACSSSLVAIHRAVKALCSGECSLAIAGGVSLILNPDTYVITSQLGALSADGRCKTFDKSANGYVKGEGVGAVLLKPLDKAQMDGDTIYAVIRASSVNHGGRAQSLTAPNAKAQSDLLLNVYSQTSISPDTISYIETHGTGTSLGDPVEIEGLKLAFKQLLGDQYTKHTIGLGSVKTNIGHLEPASGIAGLIKILLAMKHETLPGLLHLEELNPFINLENTPFHIVKEKRTWERLKNDRGETIPLRAGISSFGFGGTNAHVFVEEGLPNQNQDQSLHLNPYYLIALSARQEESLAQKIRDLHSWLLVNKDRISLPSLSYTLTQGRTHFIYRCALVVDSLESLIQALEHIQNNECPDYCLMNNGQTCTMQGPVFEEVYHAAMEVLEHPESKELYRHKLFILADLYTKQYPIEWQRLYRLDKPHRIAGLPSYPFIKQRYWYDIDAPQNKTSPVPIALAKQTGVPNWNQSVSEYLKDIFAEKLRIASDSIELDETYEVYGVDSVLGLEITNRLELDFGTLPKTILYERNQIKDLAQYFITHHKEKLAALIKPEERGSFPLDREEDMPVVNVLQGKSQQRQSTNDIAIIGLNGTFPMADSMDVFWENLASGKDCVGQVPEDRWNYKEYPVLVGSEEKYFPHGGFIPDVDKFDPLFFNISPRDAGLMDPQERLFMQSVWSTLEDAGYTREKIKQRTENSVGVFAGVTYNFYPIFIAEEWQKGNKVPLDVQSFSVANRISYFLNINGPSFVIDTACSSSLAAIHLACESIRRGECLMAIAGGVNLSLHPSKYHFLGSFSFMSDQGRCLSFGEGGSGYVPSEGVGSVLLKPLEDALRDKDKIYGVIKGSGMNHGGKTSGYTVPNPNAQASVIQKALEHAGIDPRTISYIEAHGTGTSLGDPIEIRGLQDAFEIYTKDKQFCSIGSVKSNIGHLESAAGISQLAKVLMQMKHKQIAPSIHSKELNSFIDFQNSPFYVQQNLCDWNTSANTPRRAGISSFGAGGANVHMIVEEYQRTQTGSDSITGPFLFVLSALNEDRLKAQVEQMLVFIRKNKDSQESTWIRDLCYTLQTGREAMTARLAILVSSKEELISALQEYPSISCCRFWFNKQSSHAQAIKDVQAYLQHSGYEGLAQEWVNGAKVYWDDLYNAQSPVIISAPTYPFSKRRCWIPTVENVQDSPTINTVAKVQSSAQEEKMDYQEWLYHTQWEVHNQDQKTGAQGLEGKWLIFSDKELGFTFQDELGAESCIYCFSAEQFLQMNQQTYYINPGLKKDYDTVFERVYKDYGKELKGIIYIPGFTQMDQGSPKDKALSLLYVFKGLISYSWSHQLKCILLSEGAHQVLPSDTVNMEQHHLWSMTRIFGAEQAQYQVLLMDVSRQDGLRQKAKQTVQEIRYFKSTQNHVAYRGNQRYTLRLATKAESQNTQEQPSWKAPVAALVTGGLGALGYEVAAFLADRGTRYLLLTGTTKLSAQTAEKNALIKELESRGVQVHYAAIDVADKKNMSDLIQQTQNAWQQTIDGVFHLAGVTTDNVPMADMDEALWEEVLRVKVQGSINLHEIFLDTKLSSFVLFSSIAAVPHFGMAGLSAYAAANEFMSGLALYRRSQQLPAVSINWVAWSEKGMSHRHNHDAFLDAVGMASLSIKQGMALLGHILELNSPEITVCKIQWKKFLQVNAIAKQLDFFTHFSSQYVSVQQSFLSTSLNQEQIAHVVLEALAKALVLECDEIDEETPFQNYGMDSIIGINFTADLGQHFPDLISPMDLYRYPSLKQLTDFIIQSTVPSSDCSEQRIGEDDRSIDDLSHLSEEQLNELLEKELNELELIYE